MVTKIQPTDVINANIDAISPNILIDMYKMMKKIRLVEEKIANMIIEQIIKCPCHLYVGQEAIAAGICANLRNNDYAYSTHRSHGHYLAKGGNLKSLFAELFGKTDGCSKGHGGSMHLAAADVGFPGSSAIVAGTIPLALGSALAFAIRGLKDVAVAFFGDGAATEGVFYESMNFAAVKKLPIVFVCENNFYSTHMPISEIQSSDKIYEKGSAFNIPSYRLDGNNITEVYEIGKRAIENARSGNGPSLLECLTYRWRGHVGPNWDVEKGLRSKEELDRWVSNCPIKQYENVLIKKDILQKNSIKKIEEGIVEEIEEAILFAEKCEFPDQDTYLEKVFR